MPWRRRSRRWRRSRFHMAGIIRSGLITAEETAIFRGLIAGRVACRHRLRQLFGAGFAAAPADPSRRAISFNSFTAIQKPISSIPVHAATVPAIIRVLPNSNPMIRVPYPSAARPAKSRPIPATNNTTTLIELTPWPRPKCSQPPLPRYRHIACTANRQLWDNPSENRSATRPRHGFRPSILVGQAADPTKVLSPPANAALHQGIYATIPNYLERDLRYMDAGE